jgi:2-polyprenyl-6-methoxyphenol hydroxylase-like FAD-dependent oxidoreductase
MMTENSALTIHSSPPDVEVWQTDDGITMIGDAIHAMPPTGGSGGLTAALDAAALTRKLSQSWDGTRWVDLESRIFAYEKNMRGRAKKMIVLAFEEARSYGLEKIGKSTQKLITSNAYLFRACWVRLKASTQSHQLTPGNWWGPSRDFVQKTSDRKRTSRGPSV